MNHLQTIPEELLNASWDKKIGYLYAQQLMHWPDAKHNYEQFRSVIKRSISFDDFRIDLQYNPARERSTCADENQVKVDTSDCFLCDENLPSQQKGLQILKHYLLLINPYPIFENHLTIAETRHQPQLISGRIIDMLTLAKDLQTYTIFYNGSRCGASAPFHFHFQAAQKSCMPIDTEFDYLKKYKSRELVKEDEIEIFQIKNYLRKTLVFESEYREPIDYFFSKVYLQLPFDEKSNEPMMNILTSYQNGKYRLTLFLRNKQRPFAYYVEGPERIVVSPASVEMGGIIVTPRKEDYLKITKDDIKRIYSETCLNLNINDILNI
ncbi:MAG: DUF4922 domain-containing protein [Prolixibacteraceae bacterium]